MKFYDREIETETLRKIEETSKSYAQMTVITGRRRIGKTTLVRHAYGATDMIYFFVARKSETLKIAYLQGKSIKFTPQRQSLDWRCDVYRQVTL